MRPYFNSAGGCATGISWTERRNYFTYLQLKEGEEDYEETGTTTTTEDGAAGNKRAINSTE